MINSRFLEQPLQSDPKKTLAYGQHMPFGRKKFLGNDAAAKRLCPRSVV